MNVRGKPRRSMGKSAGVRASWKKAIVTLKDGDRIPSIFEG
jgi:ribosomal protein L23